MTDEDARETMEEEPIDVYELTKEPEPDESALFRWFCQQAEIYARLQRGF